MAGSYASPAPGDGCTGTCGNAKVDWSDTGCGERQRRIGIDWFDHQRLTATLDATVTQLDVNVLTGTKPCDCSVASSWPARRSTGPQPMCTTSTRLNTSRNHVPSPSSAPRLATTRYVSLHHHTLCGTRQQPTADVQLDDHVAGCGWPHPQHRSPARAQQLGHSAST